MNETPLQGEAFSLVPVSADEYAHVYRVVAESNGATLARFGGGGLPPFGHFVDVLENTLIANFLVVERATDTVAAWTSAWGANLQAGHAQFAVDVIPAFARTTCEGEAVTLFTRYLFDRFQFRKLSCELVEGESERYLSWPVRAALEVFIPEHVYTAERFADLSVVAVYAASVDLDDEAPRRPARTRLASIVAPRDVLDRDAFLREVAHALELPTEIVQPGARLEEDLGLDSLGRALFFLTLTDLGVHLPPEGFASIKDLDDAFYYYERSEHCRTNAREGPGEPANVGRLVRVRSVGASDYETLYRLATEGPHAAQWRFRGRTPSPEEFFERLWQGVLVQYAVEARDRDELVGLVSCYDASPSGFAKVAMLAHPAYVDSGFLFEALVMLADRVFASWPMRRLLAEVPAPNLRYFESGIGRVFEQYGCLRDHTFLEGEFVDDVVLGMTREQWDAMRPRLTAHLRTE